MVGERKGHRRVRSVLRVSRLAAQSNADSSGGSIIETIVGNRKQAKREHRVSQLVSSGQSKEKDKHLRAAVRVSEGERS